MAGNPYRDEKGHLTTRVNDGGPCFHDLETGRYKEGKSRSSREEQVKASKLLGTNLEDKAYEPIKIVYKYGDKELKIKNASTNDNVRIVELEDVTN